MPIYAPILLVARILQNLLGTKVASTIPIDIHMNQIPLKTSLDYGFVGLSTLSYDQHNIKMGIICHVMGVPQMIWCGLISASDMGLRGK